MATNAQTKLRRAIARDRQLAVQRDGIFQRSTRIESAKGYKRTVKHRSKGWD